MSFLIYIGERFLKQEHIVSGLDQIKTGFADTIFGSDAAHYDILAETRVEFNAFAVTPLKSGVLLFTGVAALVKFVFAGRPVGFIFYAVKSGVNITSACLLDAVYRPDTPLFLNEQ